MKKELAHLNLSEETHSILLDWQYKVGCDTNLLEESEIIRIKNKLAQIPDRKLRTNKKKLVVKN